MAVRGFSCLSDETKITLRIDGIEETNTIKYFLDNHKNNNSNNGKIEILTEDGFKPFDGIISRGFRSTVILELSNGESLRCTNDHQLRMEDEYGEPVFIESMFLDSGDILYGGIEVVSKTEIEEPIEVFDALNVSDTHSYITNGVVSHNCNLLMLDEFAFLSSNLAEEFMASVFPTLSSSEESKLVLVSCVTKDTMVFGKDGIRTVGSFINESKNGAYYVKDYSVLGKGKFNHGNIMVNSGRSPTKIIKSPHAEIECSYEHKLWACKNGEFGWYKAKDLSEGDWVSIQYGMNIWGSNDDIGFDYSKYENDWRNKNVYKFDKITPDLAYLIGLYISEGYIDKYRLCITCGDDITYAFKRLGIKYATLDNLHYTVSSLCLCDLFRHLGFDTSKKAKDKEIPERLFSMSRENIIAMLQGLFDGDGCATKRGYITYSSTSVKLINQIRILLNNFGILSGKRKTVIAPTKRVKVFSTVYSIEINARFSKVFFENIEFQLERKQVRIELNKQYKYTRNHYDVVPESANLIRKYHLSTKCGIGLYRGKRDIQRKTLLEIRNLINDDYWNDYYEKAVSKNIYWERISNITESENEVFDFSLNDIPNDDFCHSVIYNGIIGHQTPNGMNHFQKIWKEAEEGINGFVAVRGWWNELHDQAWADKQHKLLGDVKFRAEVECEFMGSANTLVDGVKVSQIPYINPKTDQNGLRIFEPPKKDHQYFMTVDVSRGRGLDYSAFIIFDTTKTPYNVVATFKNNKISPIEFPTLIAMVGRRFNEVTILIENNDLGESVANELWYTHEYAEVLWTKDGKIAGSGTIGLRTTKSVKSKGCSNIKEIIENDQIVLNDLRILEELSVYVLGKNGQYSAQDTRINDDLCACLFLFGWLTEQDYFVDLTNINTSEILSNKFKEQLEDEGFMPFGFIDDGMTENDYPRLNQDQLELLRM